jgi:CheY-like chemotaxis protein
MIILDKEMPENLPHVLADANQLELALLNLAVNARDAMPDGGSLKIALAEINVAQGDKELSARRYVLLSVTDNGKGMDEDTLAKAVEPFFSTKELGKGTGLGLSMIHGLALQLGGSFSLESVLGSGTTAQLLIPAVEGDVVQMDVKGSSPVIMPDKQPKRILLVDDDILIAMSSADMVTDLGHEVVEAHSGAEALEILGSDQQFDLLITDYSMPGMNGADLVQAARRLVPDLPVLLASGYADLPAGVQVDAVRLGKPYTQDQLAHEISSALQA